MQSMGTLKAVVRGGRAVLVEDRVDYPEGTELELDIREATNDEAVGIEHLDAEERKRLDASLRRGLAQARSGQSRPVEDFLAELDEP
jgi:hypothetical protein